MNSVRFFEETRDSIVEVELPAAVPESKLEQPLRADSGGQGPPLTPEELSLAVRTFVLDDGNGCKPDPDGRSSEGAST